MAKKRARTPARKSEKTPQPPTADVRDLTTEPASRAVIAGSVVMPMTGSIRVALFDGARKPFPADSKILIRLIDGAQRQVHVGTHRGPVVTFELPFRDNLDDNYIVLASTDHHSQAGFHPVRLRRGAVHTVDLMLLPKPFKFDFSGAQWDAITVSQPRVVKFLSNGLDVSGTRQRYEKLLKDAPMTAAAAWNIVTALAGIALPHGGPLDYMVRLLWDEGLAQDRFFAMADARLVDEVVTANAQGMFEPEPHPNLFHPGATRSFKQTQFGEANVQLTFHEGASKDIDGVLCTKVEVDIDYFRDPLAHALLEVSDNNITGKQTSPATVYVLRWIAGQHAGVPPFDPPYTIARTA